MTDLATAAPAWSQHLPEFAKQSSVASRHVLIAGCGDVGMALADRLLRDGDRVSGLRRHWTAQPNSDARQSERFTQISADLTEPTSLANLSTSFDQIVFCPTPAARTEVAYRAIYLDGLSNLLAAVRPVDRLLFVSSTAVYGQVDGSWVDESSELAPSGFNGQVLLEAEQLAHDSGLAATAVRLAGIYGPGREYLLNQVRDGAACRADYWTNRIHRDDAARMLAHTLQLASPANCYVGVDDLPSQQCDVMGWLAQQLNVPSPPVVTNAGGANKRCSNARLRDSGFTFDYPDYESGYGSMLC